MLSEKELIFMKDFEKELVALKNILNEKGKPVHRIWNIPFEQGKFLYWLIKATNKNSILEIGTSYAYSTCWLGLAARENNGKVISLEYREEAFKEAQKNISKIGLQKIIKVVQGDAFEILKNFEKEKKQFDFVFLDSHKQEYLKQFNLFFPLLSKHAIIVADNISTHPKSTKEYVDFVKSSKNLFTIINPIGNGIAISLKL